VNLKTFELPYGKYMLRVDRYKGGLDENTTLLLHGAGKSSRVTFSRLREYLYCHGIPSASFDFVGHGETEGNIKDTTLLGRTDQAATVIKHTCREPLTLIAASMGCYSAIKLTEFFKVENLVLLVPAVYTPRVYDIPFGPKFSAKIRVQDSWKDSDAFDIISNFGGNVIIIAAEFDNVIPSELIEQLYASTINAKNRILHKVPNSKHLSLFPKEKDFLVAMDILLGGLTKEDGK
jgi:esterase/lipase